MPSTHELVRALHDGLAAERSELGQRGQRVDAVLEAFQNLEVRLDSIEEFRRNGAVAALGLLKARLSDLRARDVEAGNERIQMLTETSDLLEQETLRTERLATLGELAASVAHEIRNPLCGMTLSIEVLLTKMDPGDSRMALLGNIRREVEKMKKIVENLLHFARDYHPRAVQTDLEQSVLRSVESLAQHVQGRRIRIELHRNGGPCLADFDPDLVQTVFCNILSNAIDASADGSLVEISLLNGADGPGVAFRDHGTGMTPEVMARIFEPFFTTKSKGIGLGLAVSRKIVEAHSGRLLVESRPGQGSTFTVLFPPIG